MTILVINYGPVLELCKSHFAIFGSLDLQTVL